MRAGLVVLLVAIGLASLGLLLTMMQAVDQQRGTFDQPWLNTLYTLAFGAVAALVLRRNPRHAVGWIFAVVAVTSGAVHVLQEYALLAHSARPPLPGGAWAAWLPHWAWFAEIVLLMIVLPVVFPTGHPLTKRWRSVLWLAVAAFVVSAASTALTPGPATALTPEFGNPVAVADSPVRQLLGVATPAALFTAIAAAVGSLIVRFRRARGVERQQMKWFVYALSVVAAAFGASATLFLIGRSSALAEVAGALALLLVPLSVAIAILRYRLYDVDLLIKRTVVYGATTAAIAATFFLGIVALQAVLRPLTSGSELAVAASTLASFALFQPIRRRVQDAIDRRFDRSRYDAARTLDSFADRLRDEVDLDALSADLVAAVSRTMAPSHASVWLRERSR
jgi:hypothetical protein